MTKDALSSSQSASLQKGSTRRGAAAAYFREFGQHFGRGWNRFWYTPRDPYTLAVIRVLTGTMLLYSHFIWGLELVRFFGPDGWMAAEYARAYHEALELRSAGGNPVPIPYFSYLFWLDSPGALWIAHVLGFVVLLAMTVGYRTRLACVLALVVAVSYFTRAPTATFGFDRIALMLTLYLCVGPAGAALSVDAWLRRRRDARREASASLDSGSIGANVATRLIQVHMCLIYLASGLGKLAGASWWDGTAVWAVLANTEMQVLDFTWLAQFPALVHVLTHLTVVFELSYPVLIWFRMWRPLVLAAAVLLHLGIGLAMGLITFSNIMLIANLAFVSPDAMRRFLRRRGGNRMSTRPQE